MDELKVELAAGSVVQAQLYTSRMRPKSKSKSRPGAAPAPGGAAAGPGPAEHTITYYNISQVKLITYGVFVYIIL